MIIINDKLPEDSPSESKSLEALWFIFYIDISYYVEDKFINENQWAGFGGIQLKGKSYPYFGPTYVKPEFRGRGIQLHLLRKRIKWVKEHSYRKAITTVFDYNIQSIKNVLAVGFEEISREEDGEIFYELKL